MPSTSTRASDSTNLAPTPASDWRRPLLYFALSIGLIGWVAVVLSEFLRSSEPNSWIALKKLFERPSYESHFVDMSMGGPRGKRVVGYFVNWGIYDRKFPAYEIDHEHLTHINYSFGDMTEEGTVKLSDPWADTDIRYTDRGDSWDEPNTHLFGCLKQIYLLKKRNRNLKVLLSIGGWSWSSKFKVTNPSWRAEFVRSSVEILENVGLDGIDIDYEYPKTPADAAGYVALLAELKGALVNHARRKGRPDGQYEITIAAPCGMSNMQVLDVRGMDQYLDFWNLMAYDFEGSWSDKTGHQSNLFNPDPNGNSLDKAVWYFNSQGVAMDKLVIGMPLYGRVFAGTQGWGAPFHGVGGEGSWENGNWDYRSLPRPGAMEEYNPQMGASWSYDPHKKLFTSYDTPQVARQKAQYIVDRGLGGAMWWELDADHRRGSPEYHSRALVPIVSRAIGPLEYRENELHYPGSKYANLAAGMPGQ